MYISSPRKPVIFLPFSLTSLKDVKDVSTRDVACAEEAIFSSGLVECAVESSRHAVASPSSVPPAEGDMPAYGTSIEAFSASPLAHTGVDS